jgi:hypothetical protein
MAGLEVTIGAITAELERAIDESIALIKKLEKERDAKIKIGADTSDLDKKLKDANTNLNKFKNGLNGLDAPLNKFSKNTADGSNALNQFSRIAQDAPFGIIGIGNNITATAEAFGSLSKQAGGAGAAFKAIGASLAGPGGLLLAISLVTTALTVMAQKGITVQDAMDSLTGGISNARKELQKMDADVAKNAQAQISSVNAYVYTAKNVNLTMEERLIAVKKLQDEYPAYFGNLDKERILNGDVSKAVDDVTKALKNKARAMALTSKLVDLAGQEQDIYSNLNNFIVRLAKELGLNVKETFELSKAINTLVKSGKDFNDVQSADIDRLPERLKQYVLQNGALKDISNSLRRNLYEQDQITKKINESTAAQIGLEKQAEKTQKVYDTPQVKGVTSFISPAGLKDLNTIETFNGEVGKFGEKLRGLPGVIKTSMTKITSTFSEETAKSNAILDKFNTDIDKIINKGIAESLSGLAESIGEAFSTGGNVISAVGKSLLSTLGGVLIELGKMAIQTGVGILAISTALKSLNPYVAIAAGAALVALGSAVKGSVKGLGGGGSSSGAAFSTGGGSSSTTGTSYSTGASYTSPAAASTASGSSSFGSGSVVFEISGTSLIGVLNNTLDKNKGLGGSLTI